MLELAAATMVTAVGHFEKMHHPVLAPAVAYLLAKTVIVRGARVRLGVFARFCYEVLFSCMF